MPGSQTTVLGSPTPNASNMKSHPGHSNVVVFWGSKYYRYPNHKTKPIQVQKGTTLEGPGMITCGYYASSESRGFSGCCTAVSNAYRPLLKKVPTSKRCWMNLSSNYVGGAAVASSGCVSLRGTRLRVLHATGIRNMRMQRATLLSNVSRSFMESRVPKDSVSRVCNITPPVEACVHPTAAAKPVAHLVPCFKARYFRIFKGSTIAASTP